MILYDYACANPHCQLQFEALARMEERERSRCPRCAEPAELIIRVGATPVLFRPFLYEHVKGDVFVDSPEKLRELTNKNDQRSVYLENSGVFRSDKKREI